MLTVLISLPQKISSCIGGMARNERTLLLVISLIVPLLSADYCPAIKRHHLFWPKISLGANVTRDCSAINSSWTGKFTARCMKGLGGNVTWFFKEGCGCEIRSVLQYYETKVSQVNEANFLDTTSELENAYKQFTNQETYLTLLSRLKNSICKKTPKLKSFEWDKIQENCQTGPTEFEKQTRSDHFKKFFCQKIGVNDSLDKGVVLPSFVGSKRKPRPGIAVGAINESNSQGNLSPAVNNTLASVNSSGCKVMSYHVENGKITIKAKRNSTDSARKEKHEKNRERLEVQSPQSAEKLFIHKNFLLSWGIGYAVYIADVTSFESRNQRTALCTAVAVVRHFFQTAVFTWMLVEAVNLFIKLVKVISTRTFYLTYLAIGWGIPAVIVGITAAARTKTYDMSQPIVWDFMCGPLKFTAKVERKSCWLNGSKWLYTGPVLAILLVNLVIFVTLLKVVFGKLATKYHNDQMIRTRKGIRSITALLPLLGVTWVFGFFVDLHEVLDYIFILLTSTQGIVFCVLHCILDDQVRKAVRQRFKTSNINRSILSGKRRKVYKVNRNADMELEGKQKTNEADETFREIP